MVIEYNYSSNYSSLINSTTTLEEFSNIITKPIRKFNIDLILGVDILL